MSMTHESRPLSELVSGLIGDISGLFRQEIQLAKAEMTEKASSALSGIEVMVGGLVLALGAMGVLLAALVSWISGFFIDAGWSGSSAVALSSLIVGVVVGLIALAMIMRGRSALSTRNLKLDRTLHSLERDAAAVKERL